jgi:hypothetical protein
MRQQASRRVSAGSIGRRLQAVWAGRPGFCPRSWQRRIADTADRHAAGSGWLALRRRNPPAAADFTFRTQA